MWTWSRPEMQREFHFHTVTFSVRTRKSLQQHYEEIMTEILAHSIVKIEGAGNAVFDVIKVTDQLVKNKVARKIAVDTSFSDKSNISITMTNQRGYWHYPSQRIDYKVIVKQHRQGLFDARYALRHHQHVLLCGLGYDVLTAIKMAHILESEGKANKYDARTWVNASSSLLRINILMLSTSRQLLNVLPMQQQQHADPLLLPEPSFRQPSRELAVGAERERHRVTEQQATDGRDTRDDTTFFLPAVDAMSWADLSKRYRSQF